jgi:hypothetical protein
MPVSVLRGLITSTEDPFAPHPRDHRSDHQNDDQRDADHDNGAHEQRLRRFAAAACRRFSYSDSPTRSPIAVRGYPLPKVAAQDLHCSVHVIVRLGEDARSLREVLGVVGHRRWPVCPRAVTNCGSPRRVRVERRA